MLLHEAVKKARMDLRLSQKKLSEMAGIQRRQLATLEAGGNITLSTLRKVLAHLPNLETFTLDAVTATVRREVSPIETRKAVQTAMTLVGTALQNLAAALGQEVEPDPEAMRDLRRANEILYGGLGYDSEDLKRDRWALAAEVISPDQTMAELLDVVQAEVKEVMENLKEDEEDGDASEPDPEDRNPAS